MEVTLLGRLYPVPIEARKTIPYKSVDTSEMMPRSLRKVNGYFVAYVGHPISRQGY